MDWWNNFKCTGAGCPLTCCDTSWSISLTEKELARYEAMEHPFRETVLSAIDRENLRMQGPDGKCSLLTQEGWCRLVQECGEEYLCFTCTAFPREMRRYEDVIERTVGIACPVVAGYLLQEMPIAFYEVESEEPEAQTKTDRVLYEILSGIRAELIKMIQDSPCENAVGKLYSILSTMNGLREEMRSGMALKAEKTGQIFRTYRELAEQSGLLQAMVESTEQYDAKALLLQKFLKELWPESGRLLVKGWGADEVTLKEDILCWLADSKKLEETLAGFLSYYRSNFPMLFDNYMIYALFSNWITMQPEHFGEDLEARCMELIFIQIAAMSLWSRNKEIKTTEYEVLISKMDRKFFHTDKKAALYDKLKAKGLCSTELFLMLAIW